jgi:hypothetical protein
MRYRGGKDDGPQAPGFGHADADEACGAYARFLDAMYHPGRMGAPRRWLRRNRKQ